MGKHTPTMNNQELRVYLGDHLKNELEWLLCAATEWYVQRRIKRRIVGYYAHVYAMDSAALHARALFEFFTKTKKKDNYYGCDAFGLAAIQSDLYRDSWEGPLHAYLMHVQDRSKPRPQLMAFDRSGTKSLNQMPVDFAREIVRMWREFEVSLGNRTDPDSSALKQAAEDIRKNAESKAASVATNDMVRRYNIKPIKW